MTISVANSSGAIEVAVGQSMTINTRESIGQLVLGNADLADVKPLTDRSFYILGRKLGRTNIVAYDKERHIIGVIDVEITVDLADLRRVLRQAVPAANVSVESVNGQVRLSGTAPDGATAQHAVDIAQQYGAQSVINVIQITDSQQIMLEVRFVEASRTAGRELGVSWWLGGNRIQSVTGAINYPPPDNPLVTFNGNMPSGSSPFGTVLANLIGKGVSVDVLIQALEKKGLARRLAEPNLVALSGQTASFLAGGEIPVPTTDSNGNVNVTFKEYGVKLAFTPVVLDHGLINLTLQPEVSQLDLSTAVTANGIEVPGIITRRANTTVELHDGQSFAIGGLFQSVNSRNQNQIPWIGQLPIIGTLFRSQSFQREQTDLVIIVTPHLVRPATPSEVLATPLDATRASNDAEFFLLGLQEVGPSYIRQYVRHAANLGPHGHIIPQTVAASR
jgi:pilus assembly protein CpaC